VSIFNSKSSQEDRACANSNLAPEAIIQRRQPIGEGAITIDPHIMVNLYVSLKSKPLAILAGVPDSGKSESIRSFAAAMTKGDSIRCQLINGHAWWAEKTYDVSFFVEMQTRFNSMKLLAIIEEAWQPENRNRVFLVCMTHISPAEVLGFFSEVAYQLQHREIIRLPCVHLTEPIPYPPNLSLIGTLDTSQFDWIDEELLMKTTIIQWRVGEMQTATVSDQQNIPLDEGEFLYSRVYKQETARRKLHCILGSDQSMLKPMFRVESLLNEHDIQLTEAVKEELLIYVANAWSKKGIGLFDPKISSNLTIAFDFALMQILLPRIGSKIRDNPALRHELQIVLSQFRHCVDFLKT